MRILEGIGALLFSLFVPSVAQQARYNYTLDCGSFSKPSGISGNTCDAYGTPEQWKPIIERQLPSWYADMKLGVFIHWGIYSVPSYGSEWFWHNYQCGSQKVKAFADKNFPAIGSDYPQYASLFHAELYDAEDWVRIIQSSGAQYVLPVAKHHDGFCMWPAETSPGWNAAEVGPKRDVLTELYNASLKAGLPFGIYYSQGEWFDSDYVADYRSNFTSRDFIRRKVDPQRQDLVSRYSQAMLWHTDGGWMAPDAYWNNLDWLTGLYSTSSLAAHVVSCNSMGIGCCKSYGSKCLEYGDAPSGGDRNEAGAVSPHFYTNQMTIQKSSWSWDRSEADLADFFSVDDLVRELVSTTAWNGTLIMNMGPMADGTIPAIFQDRMVGLGKWLQVNKEAIYGSRPWLGALPNGYEPLTDGKPTIFYTARGGDHVYAISLAYPKNSILELTLVQGASADTTKAELMTAQGYMPLRWFARSVGGINVTLPPSPPIGSGSGWVVKLSGLTVSSRVLV